MELFKRLAAGPRGLRLRLSHITSPYQYGLSYQTYSLASLSLTLLLCDIILSLFTRYFLYFSRLTLSYIAFYFVILPHTIQLFPVTDFTHAKYTYCIYNLLVNMEPGFISVHGSYWDTSYIDMNRLDFLCWRCTDSNIYYMLSLLTIASLIFFLSSTNSCHPLKIEDITAIYLQFLSWLAAPRRVRCNFFPNILLHHKMLASCISLV